MRRRLGVLTLFAALAAGGCDLRDTGRDAGRGVDYYLLALSWSPEYCAETRRRDEPQCVRPYAFVAHGLWPQHERGHPEDCEADGRRVDDATIRHMLPIMPSRGLVIHEWRAHGACSGLDAARYFGTVERAYRSIRIPERYQDLAAALTTDVRSLKRELMAANPGIGDDGLVVQCSGRYLQEIRVCLDLDLTPRACGRDLRDRCGHDVILRPVR